MLQSKGPDKISEFSEFQIKNSQSKLNWLSAESILVGCEILMNFKYNPEFSYIFAVELFSILLFFPFLRITTANKNEVMENKQECKKTKDKIRSGKTLLHC